MRLLMLEVVNTVADTVIDAAADMNRVRLNAHQLTTCTVSDITLINHTVNWYHS
jgi:hypothetical protein